MSLQVNGLNRSGKATRFVRKQQTKTILTNIVTELAKSRVINARTRLRKVRAWIRFSKKCSDVQCYDGNFTDFIHESLTYLQNYPLIESNKHIGVILTE